jgi:hypothetical protein
MCECSVLSTDFTFKSAKPVGNLLTKELKAAHATRLRFYHDKELNVTAELAQAAEHKDYELFVLSKLFNAQEIFHEFLVAWRGFPVGGAT